MRVPTAIDTWDELLSVEAREIYWIAAVDTWSYVIAKTLTLEISNMAVV